MPAFEATQPGCFFSVSCLAMAVDASILSGESSKDSCGVNGESANVDWLFSCSAGTITGFLFEEAEHGQKIDWIKTFK